MNNDWLEEYRVGLTEKQRGVEEKLKQETFLGKKHNDRLLECDHVTQKMRNNLTNSQFWLEGEAPAIEKVRTEYHIHIIEQQEKGPYNNELKKRMLKIKEKDLRNLDDKKKLAYEKAFNVQEDRKEIKEYETKIYDQERRSQNLINYVDRDGRIHNYDAIVDEFSKATPNYDQGKANCQIEHKGHIWNFEKNGKEEKFFIENDDGEPIVTIYKKDYDRYFDEKQNAILEITDSESGEIKKRDDLPMDLEDAINIGGNEADKHFDAIEKNTVQSKGDDSNSKQFNNYANQETPTILVPGDEVEPKEIPQVNDPDIDELQFPGYEEVPQIKDEFNDKPLEEIPNIHDQKTNQEIQFPGYKETPLPNEDNPIEQEPNIETPENQEPETVSLSKKFESKTKSNLEVTHSDLTANDFPGYSEISGSDYSYQPNTSISNSPDVGGDKSSGPDMSGGDME